MLGTPLIGVARTLHVNDTALGRDEESIHAIVLVTVRNGCLKSGGLLHRLGIRLRLGLLMTLDLRSGVSWQGAGSNGGGGIRNHVMS